MSEQSTVPERGQRVADAPARVFVPVEQRWMLQAAESPSRSNIHEPRTSGHDVDSKRPLHGDRNITRAWFSGPGMVPGLLTSPA